MVRIVHRVLYVLSFMIVATGLIAAAAPPAKPDVQLLPTSTALPVAPQSLSPSPVPVLSRSVQGALHIARPSPAALAAAAHALRPVAPIEPQEPAAPPPPPPPTPIPGYGPSMRGTLVVQTNRIDVYVGTNTFTKEEIADYAWKLEALLRENESGFYPTKLDRRISLAFYRASLSPSRGTRGIAYTSEGRIEIYYRPDEDLSSAFTIAAHELAHHLQFQRYGESVQRRADTILHEGQATWIAGVRWLDRYGSISWKERARQIRDSGVPLRLLDAERYGANCAYDMWASFVSFLVKRYGPEKFDQLYRSSTGRARGSADYEGVLGKSLSELSEEWRAYIEE